jgi:hypothetical protein
MREGKQTSSPKRGVAHGEGHQPLLIYFPLWYSHLAGLTLGEYVGRGVSPLSKSLPLSFEGEGDTGGEVDRKPTLPREGDKRGGEYLRVKPQAIRGWPGGNRLQPRGG